MNTCGRCCYRGEGDWSQCERCSLLDDLERARADRNKWEAEAARWAARVKELEARAAHAAATLEGRL